MLITCFLLLKSLYDHVDIFPDRRKYLSFSWTFSCGLDRFFFFSSQFFFSVLSSPFGFSSAPYLFTKLFKPLIKKWRSEAKGIVCLDDGLGSAVGCNSAKIANLEVHVDLRRSGFLTNESKCVWRLTQVVSWLGTVINSAASQIGATVKPIMSLQDDLTPSVTSLVSQFASLLVLSLGNCVGNVSRLMTRNLFALINSAST